MNDKTAVKIFKEAKLAGEKALNNCIPTPMNVIEVGIDDKPYEGSKSYYVPEGMCGFASVWLPDSRSDFIKQLKKAGIAQMKKTYSWKHGDKIYELEKCLFKKGYNYCVRKGGQSIEKKEAYAEAFASVLNKYEIVAYVQSRLD